MRNITTMLMLREQGAVKNFVQYVKAPKISETETTTLHKYVRQLLQHEKLTTHKNTYIHYFVNKGFLYYTYYHMLFTKICDTFKHLQQRIVYTTYRLILYTFIYYSKQYTCTYLNSLRCPTQIHLHTHNVSNDTVRRVHCIALTETQTDYNLWCTLRYEHEHIRTLLFLFMLGTQQHLHNV